MKALLSSLLMIMVSQAWAEKFQSRVYEVDESREAEVPHLIKFENGRVGFLNSEDTDILDEVHELNRDGGVFEFELDKSFNLIAIQRLGREGAVEQVRRPEEGPQMSFEPTVLEGSRDVRNIFGRMKRGWQYESQCYNRAHVWAYEEFNRTSLRSMKLFLFFTSRYIRNYRYKWWFHVAPMVLAKNGSRTNELVLDRRYTRGAFSVKGWTDIFIQSRRSCPVVNKYSQYRNNQNSEDCYLIPVSMYYWQPRDIDRFERTGFEKKDFIKSEINWSYKEAF